MSLYAVDTLMDEARRLAREYRLATGKSLPGISGELAVHDAVRLLQLEKSPEPETGFDAVGSGSREGQRIQIKGRVIFDDKKRGQRIGQLKIDKPWDLVLLVIMDERFAPTEIWQASREVIEEALDEAKQSRRSNRGALSVAKFKNIAHLVWTEEEGEIEDEIWDNTSNG